MKLLSFVGVLALASLAVTADAATTKAAKASGRGKPGYCDDDKDCADTYTCVSVQTTRDGVENVKQCLPTAAGMPVCTGIAPGLCPSFSTTWGANFREIASVCAYILPEGKNIKCIQPGAPQTNATKGGVECLFLQNPNNETEQLGLIYGCVDFDGKKLLFDQNTKSAKLAASFNYSEIVPDNCVNPKNPQGSTFVCSSQGTCSPNSANSMDYACKCNIGFSGKYCEKIVNNKCYNDGVCGGGSCNLQTNECTDCPLGTTGNKCAQCDPTYDSTKVCDGHGTCVASSGDSTLGAEADDSASSSAGPSADAGGSDSSDNTVTTAPTTTTAAPSPATDNGDGSDGSDTGAATVVAPSLNRWLQATAKSYQCKCAEGYGDANCAVKLKIPSNKTTSTTTAPAAGSGASALEVSLAAGVATVFAALTL